MGGLFFGVLLPAATERSAYNTLSGAAGGAMGRGTCYEERERMYKTPSHVHVHYQLLYCSLMHIPLVVPGLVLPVVSSL